MVGIGVVETTKGDVAVGAEPQVGAVITGVVIAGGVATGVALVPGSERPPGLK